MTARKLRILSALAILCISASSVSARTWYVKPDGTGDAPTIQDAVNLSVSGDTVLLAPGTFTGSGNYSVIVQSKGIVITSEAGAEATVLDCQGLGWGIEFRLAGASRSVLTGLTIQNGRASYGGGIQLDHTSPRIENNIIKNCSALNWGGAIWGRVGGPTIQNNVIENCSASQRGGGIDFTDAWPTIQNNVIVGCSAPRGGGLSFTECLNLTLVMFNTLAYNSASVRGGAVQCWDSSPTFHLNTLVGNGAPTGGALFLGGAGTRPFIYQTVIAFEPMGQPTQAVECYDGAAPNFICCDIYGYSGGNAICGLGVDNISADPEFCNSPAPEVRDYWLLPTSPCWVSNSPCGQLIGAWAVGCQVTGITGDDLAIPPLVLLESYPNPFNPSTIIRYIVPAGRVQLSIFDVRGRHIATLRDSYHDEGEYSLSWNAEDDTGAPVAAGVYIVRLEAGPRTRSHKIALIR